jgi:copper chaperone
MSNSPADRQPTPSASSGAERDLVYLVEGMTCGHCKAAVTEEVSKVAGVSAVDVDLDTKVVRVHGTDVDEAAVAAAIDEAGYDAVKPA